MTQNLQQPMGYYRPYIEEAVGVLVGAPQERFGKDLGKMLAPRTYAKQAPAGFLGPKACAQCGTTRTPQWREGPEGPKTLCNACGVKRVRQMRTHSDGNKRRSTAKSPANLYKQDSSDVALGDDYYEPRDASQKRPLRKAAAKAAAKTADFASRGEWEEEDEFSLHSSQDTGSADSAGHNSDSAEEVAWVPERHAQPHHVPPSPMANAVGPECAAAVNLLSMSVHNQPIPQTLKAAAVPAVARTASGDSAKDMPKINATSYAQMANSALKWNCHLPAHAKAQEQIQEALRQLPEEKHAEMLQVKEDLDAVSREAAAADAAVAAVAKILAMKQAAAIRARTSAATAAKRIQSFMQTLDEEYGWSRQAIKRQRQT